MSIHNFCFLLIAMSSFNLALRSNKVTPWHRSMSSNIQVSAGPIVFSDPTFPNQLDNITLFYDPSEGNGALENFNGDVYAHMGLITENSVSPSDWKYVVGNWGAADSRTLMQKDTNGLYFIKYNIADHHNLPENELVHQLAFVFRNTDGSVVGRAADGSDIYLDIFPLDQALNIVVNSPNPSGEILNIGDSILINVKLSQPAFLEINDNGQLIYQDSTEEASFSIRPIVLGNHQLEFKVSSIDTVILKTVPYVLLDSAEVLEDLPPGLINGINYPTDSTIAFVLTAPDKENVFLLTDLNKFRPDVNFQLKKSTKKDKYWIELAKDQFSKNQVVYQYLVNGTMRIADPFSKVILDPSLDFAIAEHVLDGLPSYPSEYTSGRASVIDLNLTSFEFIKFDKPAKENLVIYEILLRDFLEDHSFISLQDTLEYLARLGVNAIELMPINEFEGNQSWGYNPSFHMAVDKYYGSVEELKALVNQAHSLGIAVILDVVFNHAYSQSPLAQLYWDPSKSRPTVQSPYLNPVARHPFNVGYDFNHESKYTKAWVKQILSYWIEEFHFDGFRFDLSKGLTQKNSGNNAELMAKYDPSRINILKEYADHIWSLDSASYVIMEHFAENREEKELADYGMMLWGNMNHAFTELSKGFNQSISWADYTQRGWQNANLIPYMESHDEERMMFKILAEGTNQGDYNTQELGTALQRVAAASTLYFTLPGPKMMWQFGELGFDFSINRCTSGVVNGCRLDPKPVRWDYAKNDQRKGLYNTVADLIHLRNTYPTFATTDFTLIDRNLFKSVQLRHSEMDAISMVNFRVTPWEENVEFLSKGTWYEFFSGDSIIVDDLKIDLNFLPGEYRIYLSKRITPLNGFTTSGENYVNTISLKAYPNPIITDKIYFNLSSSNKISDSFIFGADGIAIVHQTNQFGNLTEITLDDHLAPGIYFVDFRTSTNRYVAKFVK